MSDVKNWHCLNFSFLSRLVSALILLSELYQIMMKTCPYNIQRNFSAVKIENFVGKNLDSFNILAQNLHCEYTLEPPCRGGSNGYAQCMFWIKNKKIR